MSDEDSLITDLHKELEARQKTSAKNTPSSKSLPTTTFLPEVMQNSKCSSQQQRQQPRTLSRKEIERIELLAMKQEEVDKTEATGSERIRAQREELNSQNESIDTLDSLASLSQLQLAGISPNTSGPSAPPSAKSTQHPAPPPRNSGPDQWGYLSLDALPQSTFVQGASSNPPLTTGPISKKVQVRTPSAPEDKAQRVQSLEAQLDLLVESSAGVSFHGSNDRNIPINGTNVPSNGTNIPSNGTNVPSNGSNASSYGTPNAFRRSDTRGMSQNNSFNALASPLTPSVLTTATTSTATSQQGSTTDVPTLPTGALERFNSTPASPTVSSGKTAAPLPASATATIQPSMLSSNNNDRTQGLDVSRELDLLVD